MVDDVHAAGASVETFDYPGAGHLFTDASLPDEYDREAAELLWERVLSFCAAGGSSGVSGVDASSGSPSAVRP